MVSQPIKRADALVQFSKDHHFGLLLVWKIRQGIRNSIKQERIKNYINFFFDNYLAPHFKEEEQLLFSELDEHDDLRLNAIQDHNEIYQLNEQIKVDPTTTLLRNFADKLEQHIRFEERLLFAHLQNTLPQEKLDSILQKMEELHSSPKEDNWEDAFWKSNKF